MISDTSLQAFIFKSSTVQSDSESGGEQHSEIAFPGEIKETQQLEEKPASKCKSWTHS